MLLVCGCISIYAQAPPLVLLDTHPAAAVVANDLVGCKHANNNGRGQV